MDTVKRDEIFERCKTLARQANTLDSSNPDGETVKAKAAQKWAKINSLLEDYKHVSIEELSMATMYMDGSSVRKIAAFHHKSRSYVEDALDKSASFFDRWMKAID